MGGRNSGRKRTPTAAKKAGGMRLDRVHPDEPQVPAVTNVPLPPDDLHPVGKAEWMRVAGLMIEIGMLTELDLATLFGYADNFAQVHRIGKMMKTLAEKDPVTEGIVVQSPNGAAYLNPLVGQHRSAMRDMLRFAAELGLTPSSRAGIVIAERGGMGRAQRTGAIVPKAPDLAAKYGL